MRKITDFELSTLKQLIHKTHESRGTQFPNPAVGAIIIKDNKIISEGVHLICGQPHAEVLAINNAQNQVQGATILITLEPCCHKGKTARCTDHIIAAGIKRVVWAVDDPNPKTSGKSKAILERHGIEVIDNACPEMGLNLIQEFHSFHAFNRPYIYVKAAMSLDGFIAPNSDELTYISSEESLDLVQQLRTNVQAICVGSNTINVDQPRLSIRIDREVDVQPMIVILDPHHTVDLNWVKRALDNGRRIVIFTKKPMEFNHPLFINKPILTQDKNNNWRLIFSELHALGCHAVLIEGGSRIFHSLLSSKLYDELWITKTPHVLSSNDAIPFIEGDHTPSLNLSLIQIEQLGADVLMKYKNNDAFSI